MDDSLTDRVARALDRLSSMEESGYEAYLDQLGREDPELLRQVQSALERAYESYDRERATPLTEDRATETPGERIGAYELVAEVGKGTYGVVWKAERQVPYAQTVALKILKAGMDSDRVLARFDQERELLGRLSHPNVARILDGGMTPRGRPYFVMQFVEGLPITDFCDAWRLTMQERLEVFLQVCEAIQHAFLKGVIHRDLKPGNVLAAMDVAGKPLVTVIDFGVGKALEPEDSGDERSIAEGHKGTWTYMSPEQAEPERYDLDIRTDVYALGVILYQLLVGRQPLPAAEFATRSVPEKVRYLRDTEPPAPSESFRTTIAADPGEATRVAEARRETPKALAALLARELEWIPMKALRKERDRRYQSPADLAADIRRYLRGEPLEAGPESNGYRLRKFVGRNRTAVGAAAAVAVAVAVGLGVAVTQWIRAERALRESKAMNHFVLEDVFGAGEVDRYDARVTVVQLLRDSLTRVDDRFPDDAPLRFTIKSSLGRAFLGVGSPAEAIEPLRTALREIDGSSPERVSEIRFVLAEALWRLGLPDSLNESESLIRQELALLDPGGDLYREGLKQLGGVLKRRGKTERDRVALDEAETVYDEVLARERRRVERGGLVGKDRTEWRVAEHNRLLVDVERCRLDPDVSRYLALAASFEELGSATSADLGPDHVQSIAVGYEIASALRRAAMVAGATDKARAMELTARSIERYSALLPSAWRRLGKTHYRTIWIAASLASALRDLDRLDDAIKAIEPVGVSVLEERGVPIDDDRFATLKILASLLEQGGRHQDALRFMKGLEDAIEVPSRDGAAYRKSLLDLYRQLFAECRDSGKTAEADAWKARAEDLAGRWSSETGG